MAGFEFFGGVPTRISYDNTSIAVTKVIGRERELTRGFLRLESHHLFAHHFCHVRRGNEKGHVETHVGYSRRNLLVPVPTFASWAELNEYLAAACFADLFRRVRGKPETKAERLVVDLAAMLAQPSETFEPRRIAQTTANSLSLVRSNLCPTWRFEGHDDDQQVQHRRQLPPSSAPSMRAEDHRHWALDVLSGLGL